MKKINCYSITRIKPLLYTTILIILFMIIIPIISIEGKINLEPNEYIEDQGVSMQTSAEVNTDIYINGDEKIKVYRTLQDKIEEVDLEEYICGVVANEMQVSFEDEALKAQAIASRTYLVSKKINSCPIANGSDICDSAHCQVYSSKDELISKWGEENGEKYWNKIKSAVDDTKGMILTYKGELVLYPLFFSTSSGETESAIDASLGDIPYLVSVESKGEEVSPKYTSKKEMALSDLVSAINSKYPTSGVNTSNLSSKLQVMERSEAGGVITLAVGNDEIKGSDFRVIAGLNSTNFTYSINENTIVFECKGYGHGVGMSQWGANVMAKEGKSYDEILKHYYTGINIGYLKFN
ncbi:stage II sporulation protein D [uncultured Clostridium sp.]|uniref:stage II sporulation protein D n=1 Tax=uncultured Clostridium sp. TaxID=59620 RepID=UPI0025D86A4E|nr:stage II sporulation protein D [uncultured Clostridium sp.]